MSDTATAADTATDADAAADTAADTATATATAAATAADDITSLPEWAQQKIAALNRENASTRVNAKAAAAEEARTALTQEFGKVLGLVKDDKPVTPEALTEQLTQSQTTAKAAALELAIYKAAAANKADPAALLDSRTFLEKAQGIDPTDTAALAAAISEATTSNPRFKVTQAATQGSADFGSGGAKPARTYTRAQLADQTFYAANRADILSALQTGRIVN